jgi:HEPN domain-containing protein
LISPDVLYEDLCFNAQQAAEKALKALCIANAIIFPKTHDLVYLIELLGKANIILPDELQLVKSLTEYAVETRYPGDYEPITETEYRTTVEIVEKLTI